MVGLGGLRGLFQNYWMILQGLSSLLFPAFYLVPGVSLDFQVAEVGSAGSEISRSGDGSPQCPTVLETGKTGSVLPEQTQLGDPLDFGFIPRGKIPHFVFRAAGRS